MKKNLINCNNKKRISESNNINKNYHRCASVEEKINNPRFSHNLEKEFLNLKFLVKNSVERINTLFNNEEFKQKTTSKKIYNNFNKININKLDLNKENNSLENEEENKVNNPLNSFINVHRKKDNINLLKFTVNEDDEYDNNSKDLFKELKDLNSNKSTNKNNFDNNKNPLKISSNFNEDSINGSLLNLESNKLYSNREQNLNLKKINISDNGNVPKKKKNKKCKNFNNALKVENQNELGILKDKKKDFLKYIRKGNNKNKQNKQNKISNVRNSFKPKISYEKSVREETNKFSNTQKLKNLNNTLQNENISGKKNNSNSMLIDIKYIINDDNNNNLNKDKKLLSSNNNHLYKGQKSPISVNDFGSDDSENLKKKYFSGIKNLKINEKTNLKNNDNKRRCQNKIKSEDFMKMILLLNEYLINNNLFEDYSNPHNKKIIDNFSLFLANNINTNNFKSNDIIVKINDNEKNNAAIKIQRKWRKTKIEKYLINNFIEEDAELKNMIIKDILENTEGKDNNIIDILNIINNNYKLICNKCEDINQFFYNIQKIIQRKLTLKEENILYKEYINKFVCNK